MGGEAEEQQVVGLLSRAGPWLSSLPAPLGLDLGGCQTGLTLPSLGTRKKIQISKVSLLSSVSLTRHLSCEVPCLL